MTMVSSSTIWADIFTQLPRTLAMGMISRGTGTRLMSEALSSREVVPMDQEMLKML